MSKDRKIWPRIALALFCGQLLLVLVSWIWSAAMPVSGVHSLLSSEGIRWFLGRFADMMATPLLVWIVLLAMACGCLRDCGILQALTSAAGDHGLLSSSKFPGYRGRRALWLTLLLLVIYIGIVLWLTVAPHAVLLSVTGSLWPSPFSASLVPVVAFGVMQLSVVYGMVGGRFETLSMVYGSLLSGIRSAAPWLLFYILLTQFYESLMYVLS